MVIHMIAFGAFKEPFSTELNSMTLPNGAGKTTIVNAYVFALTGKALSGFQIQNVHAEGVNTVVELEGFAHFQMIRRTYTGKNTQLYVEGEAMTQTDFELMCEHHNIDIPFCASLADVNILTNPGLTSEQLRKFLTASGVYEGDEVKELRDRVKKVRAALKQAEQYALTTVAVPVRTVEELTQAETEFRKGYEAAQDVIIRGVTHKCPACARSLPESEIERQTEAVKRAEELSASGREEYTRIMAKREAYNKETYEIEQAEHLIQSAKRAREDVVTMRDQLETLETQSRLADERAIAADLPEGMEVCTDGRSQISLLYNGVPLKSVNRGKRIELCVRMMSAARFNKGLTYIAPIIVDNAESVQGIDDIPNLIKLCVG